MTLSKILLWQELKQRRVSYKFNRQTPIDNFIVDFYSKDLMLAIEIDGDSHNHEEQLRKIRFVKIVWNFLVFVSLDLMILM